MDFGWIIWVALLVAWTVIGLIVASMFGGWARSGEISEDIVASKVSYLRRKKRASVLHRTSTDTKSRRTAGGRDRH